MNQKEHTYDLGGDLLRIVDANINPLVMLIDKDGIFVIPNRSNPSEAIAIMNLEEEVLVVWRSDWESDDPKNRELFAITKDAQIRTVNHSISLDELVRALKVLVRE